MSRLRPPSVAGVAGGVGASTVAAALAGRDRGVFTGRSVDVLVCRSTCESLLLAGGAARWLREGAGCRPVLAVTADSPAAVTKPITARLALARPAPRGAGVVALRAQLGELAALRRASSRRARPCTYPPLSTVPEITPSAHSVDHVWLRFAH